MPLSLVISTKHLQFVIEQIAAFVEKETGGILLGFRDNQELRVSHIIGPGPNALHTRHSFTPDNDFHIQQIAHYYKRSKGKLTYLGDWHTHPGAKSYVSERDKAALKNISAYGPAKLPDPVMMIVGTYPFEVKCWRFTNNRWKAPQLRELNVELV